MVEVLVSLTLSMILTLVVAQIYSSNRQAYRLQEAQSRIQENGRFALELLTKNLRRVGNMGCHTAKPAVNMPAVFVNASPSPTISTVTAIQGNDASTTISGYPVSSSSFSSANWTPAAPSSINAAVAGTDIFSVQFAEPCGGYLQAPVSANASTLSILSSNTCPSSAVTSELVLSDCGSIEVFRAESLSQSTVNNTPVTQIKIGIDSNNPPAKVSNTQPFFRFDHNQDAEVMLFRSYTYFIGLFNSSEPTLYQIDNVAATTPQPIIEGVEDMQLLYGIDVNKLDGSVDQYLTASDVDAKNGWANVIAVRVDLVLRSTGADGDNVTVAKSNACNGTPVTDNRLRRCYSFTINLRNPRA